MHCLLCCRDKQLELWHKFAAGRDAEKGIVAMHTHLGHVPSGRLAATALGLDTSVNLAKCLQDGQVSQVIRHGQSVTMIQAQVSGGVAEESV